ncbi:1-(5-phosphoribosyl)-5-[(5-phosphoribosylamino)methylideneamino]imidazole-4-carboxamide isomerase [Acetobacter sp.]|jgi:phosphoribosylformimino-5-aminoimidazole carboxamide ribotide isomerase|uniref:1-(5-phosphoribosyl)-5-[(5- phosphoribosylamino)methylideneamino]imidazole-4- carboxamide isomerase n=1 Tax=Acetobacter sp. TaxID=440 RepID=UPI0025BEB53E|nr:1-(5-phosphoribosyl)-5-[(5-phosphoribosylamino)methylideneamino]imidazole-4-carboxamide isomerase [Acetobacter sp.]MCH4091600.1 1-(5-phosphoribosyl)-5-[(5-phosphoribosylamino)methylideneamino]imidazole-4-carboxamide isomerase [Acetobacter sp.]MCI1301164.1 1-(5-phosphoribosyl)-5-[(5-phosphoribosylamino)methylideneamino]imidazole-4-carboxamide isomerase [Acetobacter sp.]MCI1317432.1 1-(5-phosphoribosyl)-5-[(5-phosphoribosylamino)methylideneamino]imidazole-4-carboxamide isomerase [Acetobacter sp
MSGEAGTPGLTAERIQTLNEDDLPALCECVDASILGGGGFAWVRPQGRSVLERYFRGILLVPERLLFVARQDGLIVGSAQMVRPSRSNEAQAMIASVTQFHIAPYARGIGLGRLLIEEIIKAARAMGYQVLNLDVRETQTAAMMLFRNLGFEQWGVNPYYAAGDGRMVRGHYFFKRLQENSRLLQNEEACEPDHGKPADMTARALTLYPAIDLKDGACVRLRRGEMDDATVYSDDPGAQARAWCAAGFNWLHVVDLNGAFAGRSANSDAVKQIVANAKVPVQLGGGLRDLAGIESWLEAGISRVILGSVAVKNPDLVKEACRLFPGRIMAGIDARMGLVATEGWAEVSDMQATDLGLRMQDAGVAAIIFTEITRDGMLQGLDLEQTAQLAQTVSVPVIASGGVGSLDDLAALRRVAADVPGIEGVIVGRALYDGRISPADALRVLS